MTDEPTDEIVFRVRFSGSNLPDNTPSTLRSRGVYWEGSEHGPSEPSKHRALVEASSLNEAITTVKTAVDSYGAFTDFEAAPITDSNGELWKGGLHGSWEDIDWEATPQRSRLSELDRGVLWVLTDAGEATWILAQAPQVPTDDRNEIDAALEELERNGWVYHTIGPSCEPETDWPRVRWWAITDEGWDRLGLIKSSEYW